jgi:hypothetical protein
VTTKPYSKRPWLNPLPTTQDPAQLRTGTGLEQVVALHQFNHKQEREAIRLRDSTPLVSLAPPLREHRRIGSKRGHVRCIDGQAPNNAVPYPSNPPQPQSGFQPPYPVSSPPPQSHTPSNLNHQPPPSGQSDGYASYPPTNAAGPIRRQSHPSEAYTGYPPAHPTIQPPNISQLQLHDDPAKDYSPSNYSMDEASNQHPLGPSAPLQSQPSYPPPMPQSQAPTSSQPPQASYAPLSQPPANYDYPPQNPMSPPPPSHGPPPIPQGGPGSDPTHRPVTPLAQNSAYPVFSPTSGPAQHQQQYQAYNQRPTSYYR